MNIKPELLTLGLAPAELVALAAIEENHRITRAQLRKLLNMSKRGVVSVLARLKQAKLLLEITGPCPDQRRFVVCLPQTAPIAQPAQAQPEKSATDALRECYRQIQRYIALDEEAETGNQQAAYGRAIHGLACDGLKLLDAPGLEFTAEELALIRQRLTGIRDWYKTTGALMHYGWARPKDRAIRTTVNKLLKVLSQATPEQLAAVAATIPDDHWRLPDGGVKQLALTVGQGRQGNGKIAAKV